MRRLEKIEFITRIEPLTFEHPSIQSGGSAAGEYRKHPPSEFHPISR
jgi:hypothetical protein